MLLEFVLLSADKRCTLDLEPEQRLIYIKHRLYYKLDIDLLSDMVLTFGDEVCNEAWDDQPLGATGVVDGSVVQVVLLQTVARAQYVVRELVDECSVYWKAHGRSNGPTFVSMDDLQLFARAYNLMSELHPSDSPLDPLDLCAPYEYSAVELLGLGYSLTDSPSSALLHVAKECLNHMCFSNIDWDTVSPQHAQASIVQVLSDAQVEVKELLAMAAGADDLWLRACLTAMALQSMGSQMHADALALAPAQGIKMFTVPGNLAG